MEKVLLSIMAASALLCGVSSLTVRRYHFVYENKNWTDARRYCREKYSDLVTVDNMEVVETLNKMADLQKMNHQDLPNRAWIGLYEDVNSWRWSMSDRLLSETDFRKWAPGRPNNKKLTEYCARLFWDNVSGNWDDENCDYKHHSICSDVKGQNVTFVYIPTSRTWTEAQSYCRQHHTDLASVNSLAEHQQIKKVLHAGKHAWIGLYRDSWKWVDGRNLSFSYWRDSEPNDAKELCVSAYFRNYGRWEDVGCSTNQSFICYRDHVVLSKHAVRVKLRKTSSLDLNEPAVLENLLKKFKQKLQENGVKGDIKLSWKKRSTGKIFTKDEL